jgi:hypothetical protein
MAASRRSGAPPRAAAGPRNGLGKVDDVEHFWAAEAGDLHGSHGLEAMGWQRCRKLGEHDGSRLDAVMLDRPLQHEPPDQP